MKRLVFSCIALFMLLLSGVCYAEGQFRLLVLAVPSKYHYEFVPVSQESLTKLAALHAFDITWATTTDALNQNLQPYAAILLLNTPVEDFTPDQRAHLEAYMLAGGNAVVVHRAAIVVPSVKWPWYEKLVGRSVGTHPMLQTGVVSVTDHNFPATFGVPMHWLRSDEFYPLSNPYNVAVSPVLNVDETSYDPTKIWPGQVAKGMGRDHPVAWYHHFEKGRVFVTTLGHNAGLYREDTYLNHLMGGIYWAVTGWTAGETCSPSNCKPIN